MDSTFGEDGYLRDGPVDGDMLLRWSATIQPLPLPPHLTPVGGTPLKDVPDEVLMKVSPHIITHMQRTASQGGLQIVSPRQTPFCKTMIRTVGGERKLGDHVVGSIADEENVWPTIDDADMSDLLPDEPLPSPYTEKVSQPKTKTTPLTRANKLLSDPILACLIKGRAVIDILRRDDVAGDSDTLLELLADAWGVPTKSLNELDAYTLGIDGPLLRHAIKSDEVYPTMYAPVHVKRCISMGVSEVTRGLLPVDTAMDWKRARVFCEAVYSMAMSIEGLPLSKMRCIPSPGDPSARTDRRGILVFQPGPASAWTFSPHTFSIYPLRKPIKMRARGIPSEVLDALVKYVDVVRPVSHALIAGHRAVAKRSVAIEVQTPQLETITEGYVMMIRSMVVGSARGRTAAATVRNIIYDALNSCPPDVQLRIARYMHISKLEVKIHLGLDEVPDSMIGRLADRFVQLGSKIRTAVLSEAARRGATAEEWWSNILSQVPERYHGFTEGTMGWTRVALWLAFRGNSPRWENLIRAIHANALHEASTARVHGMALPAKIGSVERLLQAARLTVKEVSTTFASYYHGVADVGLCLADEALEMGRTRTADVLREASYLWVLRARCFRGTNVNPLSHDECTKSVNHFRVSADPVDLALVPAPYRAFDAYLSHVSNSPIIPTEVKIHMADKKSPVISEYFQELHRPIIPAKVSTVTKYLTTPYRLAEDLEKSWQGMLKDLRLVALTYGQPRPPAAEHASKRQKTEFIQGEVFEMPAAIKDDYYASFALLSPDQVDWIEETLDQLPPEIAEDITSATYTGVDDLVNTVMAAVSQLEHPSENTAELVM